MAEPRDMSLPQRKSALRLGLCCQFVREPIKFRATTVKAMVRLPRRERLARLADMCLAKAEALLAALKYCASHRIGAIRVNSPILPVKSHAEAGYNMTDLPGGVDIITRFRECGHFARENHLRLSFHPDQFVALNSPNARTLAHSLAELNYQAEVAEWAGADTLNIHGGGA